VGHAPTTVKILHLSDLHISADPAHNAVVAQKIEFVRQHYADHHIVITGDIIDNEGHLLPGTAVPVNKDDPMLWQGALASPPPPLGAIEPHLEVTRRGLRAAHELLSRLPRERTYVCGGNHDFGLWGNFYENAFVDAFNDLIWQPINGGKPVLQLGIIDNALHLPHAGARVPVAFTMLGAGFSVQLILLNTNADPTHPGTLGRMASGFAGGEQLTKLETAFAAEMLMPNVRQVLGVVRIYAFHHHPFFHDIFHKIDDADALVRPLRSTADLVIFGHRHVQKRYAPESPEGNAFRFGALASGWIRGEATAAEITIDGVNAVNIAYVPLA
jgi:3',5'-cyclic AMP phosphodiesterase CpdA